MKLELSWTRVRIEKVDSSKLVRNGPGKFRVRVSAGHNHVNERVPGAPDGGEVLELSVGVRNGPLQGPERSSVHSKLAVL